MRIQNVMGVPRFFSYVGKHGRTLKAGETSPVLPIETAQLKLFKADVDAGKVKVTLDAAELASMKWLVAAHEAEVKCQEPVKQLSPAEKAKAKRMEAIQAEKARLAARGLLNPGGGTGQPSFMPSPSAARIRPEPAIPVVEVGDSTSLAQLKAHNAAYVGKPKAAKV